MTVLIGLKVLLFVLLSDDCWIMRFHSGFKFDESFYFLFYNLQALILLIVYRNRLLLLFFTL